MTKDTNTLTPAELHAVQSMLNAVKAGNESEARWWSERREIVSALAKMRAQAKENAS